MDLEHSQWLSDSTGSNVIVNSNQVILPVVTGSTNDHVLWLTAPDGIVAHDGDVIEIGITVTNVGSELFILTGYDIGSVTSRTGLFTQVGASDTYLKCTTTGTDYLTYTYDASANYINFQIYPGIGGYASKLAHATFYINSFKLNGVPQIDSSVDPYEPAGDSDQAGGGGSFDGSSDSIGFDGLPALNVSEAGFITLYNPSLTELRNLSDYMWGNSFDISTLKKLLADPMDAILGLSLVPVSITSGGTGTVCIGNISTGVSMTLAGAQFYEVDCGTLTLPEYWKSYLDYDPFTKIELYLPYIGTHPVSADDIMGKSISIKYQVDILSGACVARVKCGNNVLYSFIGQCAVSIPITQMSFANALSSAVSIAGAIGTMVATGGATAPLVGGIASSTYNAIKPSIQKSGTLSGTGGFMGHQKPYFIITRPRQAKPANQNTYLGYPSFITATLSDLTGYTEVYKIHLEGMSCTNAEARELESILKEGVIF